MAPVAWRRALAARAPALPRPPARRGGTPASSQRRGGTHRKRAGPSGAGPGGEWQLGATPRRGGAWRPRCRWGRRAPGLSNASPARSATPAKPSNRPARRAAPHRFTEPYQPLPGRQARSPLPPGLHRSDFSFMNFAAFRWGGCRGLAGAAVRGLGDGASHASRESLPGRPVWPRRWPRRRSARRWMALQDKRGFAIHGGARGSQRQPEARYTGERNGYVKPWASGGQDAPGLPLGRPGRDFIRPKLPSPAWLGEGSHSTARPREPSPPRSEGKKSAPAATGDNLRTEQGEWRHGGTV